MWGTQPRFLARVSCALNSWVISLAPGILFLHARFEIPRTYTCKVGHWSSPHSGSSMGKWTFIPVPVLMRNEQHLPVGLHLESAMLCVMYVVSDISPSPWVQHSKPVPKSSRKPSTKYLAVVMRETLGPGQWFSTSGSWLPIRYPMYQIFILPFITVIKLLLYVHVIQQWK